MADSKLILHHLENSRGQRIIWLLEELGVPYELKVYKRQPDRRAPKELSDIHPLGKSPVVTDGDVVIAESGAIVEYLIGKYGGDQFKVPESGFVDNLYFTHYAEGSIQPILVNKLIFSLIPTYFPWFLRPFARFIFNKVTSLLIEPQLAQHGKFLEGHFAKLNEGAFIAGGTTPTSADFLMIFALETFVARGQKNAGPKTIEYLKRLSARPGYKVALEKSGEHAYAYKG